MSTGSLAGVRRPNLRGERRPQGASRAAAAATVECLEARMLLSVAAPHQPIGFVIPRQPSAILPDQTVPLDHANRSATISAPDVTDASAQTQTVTVTYASNAAIDPSTINVSNITLSGVVSLPVSGVTVVSVSGGGGGDKQGGASNSLTAAYTVPAPQGGWVAADDGVFTVSLLPNQVRDANGTAIPPAQGSFRVSVGDTAPPTATITAPALTSGGGMTFPFTITYADDVAIDVTTIGTTNVTVTGPDGGRSLGVMSATVDNNTNGTPRTVTYTVAAPRGTWSASDDGIYTITLNPNQVLDTGGLPAASMSGTFSVNIAGADTTPPTAAISAPSITTPGGTTQTVTVTYADDVAVDASTIATSNITVTAPDGSTLPVTDVSLNPTTNAASIAATYTIAAPAGGWSAAADGNYTVSLNPDAVQDTSGNAAASVSSTFTVNIGAPDTAPPSAQISAPDISVGGGTTETIAITYTDDTAVNAASINAGNISVTGPGGPLVVTAAQASGGNGSPLLAIYTVAAPHGAWSSADDGSYIVAINANQVSDTSGNFTGGASGSFAVNIPAPNHGPADMTFANGQTVSTRFVTEAIVTDPNGGVLAVGHQGNLAAGASQGVIERFNSDGSLDANFGNQGMVISRAGVNEAYFAVVMQDANHFIVAGTSGGDFVLARYDLRGNLDGTFGAGGRVTTDFGTATDAARGVAIAPGGMIVAGGDSGGNFAFARYDADGHLDPNFAQNGRQLYGLGAGNNGLGAIAVQADGKIVAAGSEGGSVVVVRLTAAGEADGTFGNGGLAVVGPLAARQDLGAPDRSEGLALEPNGDILVANRTATGHFGLARLNPNGNLDTTFGTNGMTTANFGGDDDADSIVLEDNGSIVVIGTSLQNGTPQTAVAAFDAAGNPLTGFGSNGLLMLSTGLAPITRALHVGDIILRAFGVRTPDGRVVIGTTDEAIAATTSSSLRRLLVPGAQVADINGSGTPLGSFGIVNGHRKKLTFHDADGTTITLSLVGGTGMAFLSGDRVQLVIDDLGRGVLLVITGRGGDNRISLSDVTISGTLRSMIARNSDLFGTLHVTGAIGNLALGNISGTIWSGDAIANLSAGDLLSGDVFATTTLGRLKFGHVSGTIASGSGVIGSIAAASLDSARLLSGANLGADGMVGGSGPNADTYGPGAIGSIKIAGTIKSSFIGAGVQPVGTTFGGSGDKGVGGASSAIRFLSARGADQASRFEAGAFGRVKLPAMVDVLHDPRFRTLAG